MKTITTKKPRMPLVMLAKPGENYGGHVYCDYCAEDAVWYHWANSSVDRDCYACNEHVSKLNFFYGQEYHDEIAKLVASRTK